MSIDIHLKFADDMALKDAALILIERMHMTVVEDTDRIIQGVFKGGNVGVRKADARDQDLCDGLYGVIPKTIASFNVDKFAPYAVSYGNILDGILALVKATKGNAIAAVEDRPFLRRLNGQVTLYNTGGLFDSNVVPQWRPKFDFECAFKEQFER